MLIFFIINQHICCVNTKNNIFIEFIARVSYINDMNHFGNGLKGLRKEKGLTQKELAAALSVSPQVVSRWEKSKDPPSYRTMMKLAKALGTTTNNLMLRCFPIDPEEMARIVEEARKPTLYDELLKSFNALNEKGQRRAVDFTEDLTKIPEYRSDTQPE